MPNYPKLASLLGGLSSSASQHHQSRRSTFSARRLLGGLSSSASQHPFRAEVLPYLADVWLDDYASSSPGGNVVQVTLDGFSYLFDVVPDRLVAAGGIGRGRHGGDRDATRMAGHPLSAGPLYHRGHAIPHTLGGPTDINLVAQLGAVNIGPFRPLERRAVATPGSLYFTYWIYGPSAGQTPIGVEQGLLVPGCREDIRRHRN